LSTVPVIFLPVTTKVEEPFAAFPVQETLFAELTE
jgi:hypothetical protein